MNRVVVGIAVGAVMTVAGTAVAAPLGPTVKKISIAETDVLKPSAKHTEASIRQKFAGFSVDRTYKTAGGATITGRKYLELVNLLQAAADKAGCTLGSGKSCNFVAKETKLSQGQLTRVANLAKVVVSPKRLPALQLDRPAKDPLGFSWYNDWGTPSRAAVYVGAEFGHDGSASSSSCGGSAYAGVYVFNNQREVLRLEGELRSAASVEASAGLFVLGESMWTQTRSFATTGVSFEKSFKVNKSFSYWGLVTINLSAKTTASATLAGALTGSAGSGSYTCSLRLTPGVNASLGGSAEIAILGYGDLSAAAVGVEANVLLADVSLPITASAAVARSGSAVKFTESLSVDLAMTYLRGSLDAYFSTSFPLDGESVFDWDRDRFTFTLLEFDGYTKNINLFSGSQEQTL